jgi:type II secretory pathway component PulL
VTAPVRRHIRAYEFGAALKDAGIIEDVDDVRRVVIDANADCLVMVYVERYADDRWLNVHLGLHGIEVTTRPAE